MIGSAGARGGISLSKDQTESDKDSDLDYGDHSEHKHKFKVFCHIMRRKDDDPKFIKFHIKGINKVIDMKQKIKEVYDKYDLKQDLIYNGQVLLDHKPVAFYKIKSRGRIWIVPNRNKKDTDDKKVNRK